MNKNFDNGLNVWLSVFLAINIVIAPIVAIKDICVAAFGDGQELGLMELYVFFLRLVLFYGCIRLFLASKVGFYTIVACSVLDIIGAIVLYFHYKGASEALVLESLREATIVTTVGHILRIGFLMLLMLLRYKGKNAYQVLWGK